MKQCVPYSDLDTAYSESYGQPWTEIIFTKFYAGEPPDTLHGVVNFLS